MSDSSKEDRGGKTTTTSDDGDMQAEEFVPPPGLDLDLRLGVAAILSKIQLNVDADGVIMRNCDRDTGEMATNFDNLEGLLELMAIFEAVAFMPKLKHVQIHFAKSTGAEKPHPLPAQLLSMIINQCLDIYYLRLQGLMLSDANGKYEGFANSLRMHPCLERIHFILCAPEDGLTFDPILAALPGIPSLQEVELVDLTITSPSKAKSWTGDTLLHLALSKNLSRIRLSCIRYLLDTHIQAMALAHEKSETLRVLVIEGEDDEDDSRNGDEDDLYKDESHDEGGNEKKEKKKEPKKKKKKELVNKKKETKKKDKEKDKQKDKDNEKDHKKKAKKDTKKGKWRSAETADGKVYYYNKKTGETTWNRPADF